MYTLYIYALYITYNQGCSPWVIPIIIIQRNGSADGPFAAPRPGGGWKWPRFFGNFSMNFREKDTPEN